MITYLIVALTCMLLALLINLPMILRERRLRKLAWSKLQVTRTVNEMNELMLAGQIKAGNICHDRLFPIMMRTQFDGKFSVTWKFWNPPTEENKKLREAIHLEISSGTPLGKILERFSRSRMQCFWRQQPFVFFLFSMWVLVVAGGLVMLLVALLGLLKAKMAWRNLCESHSIEKSKQLISEWVLILSGNPDPQFQRH